jgi:hypothetical protein
MKKTLFGFRESNEKNVGEVIKISKNSSLVKSYNNNDHVRMASGLSLKTTFWMSNLTLTYAQKKLGFVAHTNNEMPFKLLKWFFIAISLVIRNTAGVYVFDTVLKKFPHFTSKVTGLREAKELFFNY